MTELIWDGKYDQEGRRVAPLRVVLPFQTVESVNESAQQRQRMLDLFTTGRDADWRNRLVWGDKKYVLPSLLEEFAGQVNLVYIDPPFNVGADFSFTASIPDAPDEEGEGGAFTKEPSVIEQKAYRDTWGRGLDGYLQWFYETVVLLRELLAEDASIYVHLDWHMSHYAKIIMDEVFGTDSFVNEIVWKRSDAHNDVGQGARSYGRIHDCVMFYTRSNGYVWNPIFTNLPITTVEKWYRHVEEGTGRRYNKADLTARKPGGNTRYEWNGVVPPTGRYWAYSLDSMRELESQGRIVYSSSGTPYMKRYLDESRGVSLQDWWDDISMIRGISGAEKVGYATQKPEALLERIIKTSSNEGDLVLDCFCGSGTTAAVAEKLNRRWIACDLGRFAIHTTRKRLLSIPNVKPFVVQNLGKYERQAWQAAAFGGGAGADRVGATGRSPLQQPSPLHAYRQFILDLYHARPLTSTTWLHGVKAGRMIYVGPVDAPVSVGDVTAIISEFKRAVGTGQDAPASNGIDVLGWDFAFELNEVAKQQAAQANVNLRFHRIPRDVMDKRAVAQGDVRFFELAALAVDVQAKKRQVTLTLTDFVIPPDDVPEDVRKAVRHWSQWIDYWAVDWDNKGDTFHNQWQTYRTRKDATLERAASHVYEAPGTYLVCVKVIDILGNDTTKTLPVEVK